MAELDVIQHTPSMQIDPALLTLCSGVVGVIIGAALGAWLTAAFGYTFQKKLLLQQLDFFRQQAQVDAALRQKIHDQTIEAIHEIRHQIHSGFELARLHPRGDLR